MRVARLVGSRSVTRSDHRCAGNPAKHCEHHNVANPCPRASTLGRPGAAARSGARRRGRLRRSRQRGTNAAAGARYGHLLVWVVVVANSMAGPDPVPRRQARCRHRAVAARLLQSPAVAGRRLAFWAQAEVGHDGDRPGRGRRRRGCAAHPVRAAARWGGLVATVAALGDPAPADAPPTRSGSSGSSSSCSRWSRSVSRPGW